MHRGAVIEAEHDDNHVRLLGSEDALGRSGPVGGLTLGLILNETGNRLRLADHAYVGLFRIGVFQTIAQPVCHGVAEHQNVTLRYGFAFLRRRRFGKILTHRRLPPLPTRLIPTRLGTALLEWPKHVVAKPSAAKPAATALWRRPLLKSAEIEKLRRGGTCKAEQHRRRNCQRNERAASVTHVSRLVGHAVGPHKTENCPDTNYSTKGRNLSLRST